MTIKAIKEKYAEEHKKHGANKTMFTTWDWGDGKCVIIVIADRFGKDVVQVVKVSTGEELLPVGKCRPCDNLDDAIDVAGEMI